MNQLSKEDKLFIMRNSPDITVDESRVCDVCSYYDESKITCVVKEVDGVRRCAHCRQLRDLGKIYHNPDDEYEAYKRTA